MSAKETDNNDLLVLQLEYDIDIEKWDEVVKGIRNRLLKQTNKEVIVIPRGINLIRYTSMK